MNKIFRVIWNGLLQRYVVASELAKGKVKSQSSRAADDRPVVNVFALSGLAIAVALSVQPVTAFAAGAVVADGSAVVMDGEDVVSGTKSGLSAANNGTIDFSNGSITTQGTTAFGALANSGSTVTLSSADSNNPTTITTAGSRAHGMYALAGGTINGNGLNITTSGSTAYGLQTNNVFVTLNNSSIKTSGASGVGAWAQGANGNLVMNNTTINTTGEKAHALYAMGGGLMTVNDSIIAAEGHIAAGAWATGAGSVININNSTLSTAGTSSEAAYANAGGKINLTNTSIHTKYINSYGLRTAGKGSEITFDGGTITTEGNASSIYVMDHSAVDVRNAVINAFSYGATVAGTSTFSLTNSTVNSGYYGLQLFGSSSNNLENVIVNTYDGTFRPGEHTTGIFAYGAGTTLAAKNIQVNSAGKNAMSFQAYNGATATLDNVEINNSNGGSGLQVLKNSSLTGNNVRINVISLDDSYSSAGLWMGEGAGDNNANLSNSQITVSGVNGAGLLFGATAENNNNLSLSNSMVSAVDGPVIKATGPANVDVVTSGSLLTGASLLVTTTDNKGSVGDVKLTGDNGSVFTGDVAIDRANTGTTAINLDHNSSWTGATGTLENLSVANGSQWNVTASSAIDNVSLDNGTLNMTAPGSGYSEVTVGSLNSNNGTVAFKTHLVDDNSQTDHLHITGDYSGNSNVVVQNAGGTGATTLNGIELVRVDGAVNGTFMQQGRIAAGAYDYHLVQDGNRWLLANDVAGTGIGYSGGLGGAAGKGTPVTRPEGGTYAANQAAANTLFTTSLHDRAGETTYIGVDGQAHSTSLWLRNAGGHTRFSDSSGQLKTTGNRYVMQLGGDVAQLSSNGSDSLHLGVMGGYANAQSKTRSGITGYTSKGQVNGYSTGVYGTWYQNSADESGAYVDSWALYNWFNNSVKGEGIGEESYKSKGITASVEAGYSIKVADLSKQQGVFVQPQAQLTWMGVKAGDHKEGNGTRIVSEGNNNVQSRLGVRAMVKSNHSLDADKKAIIEPFVEANWLHNSETFGSSMNGVSIHQAGARNLAEVKVGVDATLNKTVKLWGNIGQQVGNKSYSDTGAMVGVKVSF